MPNTMILSLDDSGTRHPDKKQGRTPKHGNDWFALGGILFEECAEAEIRKLHAEFCQKWNLSVPLHSVEIRARSNNFAFLGKLSNRKQGEFYEELYGLLRDIPAVGHACVIDRPQYNHRYAEKYGGDRWLLCKSAFSIVVERAAKIAASREMKLRVQIERSDKKVDRKIKTYYDDLREHGLPFAKDTSGKYDPAESKMLQKTLYEFRPKQKSSPLMQLADLYLWPICMGGYNRDCLPYHRLSEDKKIVDCVLESEKRATLGVKYYCFDNKKPGETPGFAAIVR